MSQGARAPRGRLQPVQRTSLYQGVLERIREYARAESLRQGDRLPSERDLAAQLGASRNTVKQALVVLEVQGLVETRHGGGTFLLRDDLLTEDMTTLLSRRDRLPHVLDARMGLEVKLAELAAARRTDQDIEAISKALATMAAAVTSHGDANPGDKLFHEAVAAAARSPILSRFLEEISTEISESRAESLRQRGRPEQSLSQHSAIADAIASGNAAAARAAMEAHLTSVSELRLLHWTPEPTPTPPDSSAGEPSSG